MLNIKIVGSGAYLPQNTVKFGNETRYRCTPEETQLDMAEKACLRALDDAHLTIRDIDCLVSASAVGVQPNVRQQTSYELFSDGACAFIIQRSDNPHQGILAAMQRTYSEGAHFTEIRGGLTRLPAQRATVEFYNNLTCTDMILSVEGITLDGKLLGY